MSTNKDTIMTDQEIIEVAAELSAKSLNMTRVCGFGESHMLMEDAGLIELARTLLSRAIPEGHVVVPKKPTPEMLFESGFRMSYAQEVWAHMIAAAPANKEG